MSRHTQAVADQPPYLHQWQQVWLQQQHQQELSKGMQQHQQELPEGQRQQLHAIEEALAEGLGQAGKRARSSVSDHQQEEEEEHERARKMMHDQQMKQVWGQKQQQQEEQSRTQVLQGGVRDRDLPGTSLRVQQGAEVQLQQRGGSPEQPQAKREASARGCEVIDISSDDEDDDGDVEAAAGSESMELGHDGHAGQSKQPSCQGGVAKSADHTFAVAEHLLEQQQQLVAPRRRLPKWGLDSMAHPVNGSSSGSLVPVPVSAAPPQAAVMGSAAVLQGTGQALGSSSSVEGEKRAAAAAAADIKMAAAGGGSTGDVAAAVGKVGAMVSDSSAPPSSSIRRPVRMMTRVLQMTGCLDDSDDE